jgi:hypothetical protein
MKTFGIVVLVIFSIHMLSRLGRDVSASSVTSLRVGDQGVISGDVGKDTWTCAPTQEALDEIVTWIVKHDKLEARRAMIETKSFTVASGQHVKILDDTFTERKIRILSADDGSADDPRIGRSCWVVREAVN